MNRKSMPVEEVPPTLLAGHRLVENNIVVRFGCLITLECYIANHAIEAHRSFLMRT